MATLHDLDHELGAAARLAVDNERLRAEALVQLDELRASRSRIVAAGDATRRRLERDLHDGAQQTLLAALYELRLAASSAERAGAADVAATLVEAGAEAQRTIDDLRELAHGIFPAILTEAGLGPALWTLADRAPLPVEIADLGAVGEARYPAGAETAAYLVVAGAVDDAAGRGATHVTVSITVAGAPARSGSGSAPVDGPAASTKAWSGPDPAVDPGLAGVAAVAAPWTASGAGTRTATGAASGSRTAPSVGGDPSGGAVRLVVEARDDGSAPADGRLVHVADRVSALGGRLELDGTAVRAVIPCG